MDDDRVYLENSYKTLKKMLNDRGYTHIIELEGDKEFYHTITFTINLKEGGVLWPRSSKLGINHVSMCTKYCEDENWDSFIIVCNGSITACAKKEILNSINLTHNGEMFFIEDVQNDITSHSLVPIHRKVSEDEKEKVMNMYGKNLKKYPLMFESEPISRYYNYKEGDLIEIERKTNMSYRYVTRFVI